MTPAQIVSTLASLTFAVAFTSVLRKLFTKADGSCPIDGKIVWALVLVLNIAGGVLGTYADSLPPVVWAILGPIVGAVIGIGGVQTISTVMTPKTVEPEPTTRDPQVTKPEGISIKVVPPLMLLTFAILLSAIGYSCAAAAPACKVIDALHDGCVLLKYESAPGKVESVQVTPAELHAFGKLTATRRSSDAGVDQ